MEQQKKNRENDYVEIDLLRVFRALWKNIILILAAGIFCAGAALVYTNVAMTPKYSSTVTLYVNNKNDGNKSSTSISSADITSAKYLVKTYIAILTTRESLQMVKEHAKVDYSTDALKKMISSAVVNDTEVFRVTVTTENPYVSRDIAASVAEVLPQRIAEILDGSTMRVVDSPVVSLKKVSPNTTKNVTVGFLIGALVVCAGVVIRDLMDDVIHDEDYFLQNYSIPILASIPDLLQDDTKKYGRYGKYGHYGYESAKAQDTEKKKTASKAEEAETDEEVTE